MTITSGSPLPLMELGDETPIALYRLFDAAERLLYVGISDNIKKRFAQHAAVQPWWPEVARKTVQWYPDRPAAEAAEVAAIRDERPVHNVIHSVTPPAPIVRRPVGTVEREELAALLDLEPAALRLRLACIAWQLTPREAAAELGMPERTYRRAKRGRSSRRWDIDPS